MYKCTNCEWEGEEAVMSKVVPQWLCPVCGDNAKEIVEEFPEVKKTKKKSYATAVPKPNLDLNNDGKVDKKDASIAGKVMRKFRRRRKRK